MCASLGVCVCATPPTTEMKWTERVVGKNWNIIGDVKIRQIKQEIAANYEKYIRARDPFPWRSIHQNLNSLGNSFCSDSNSAGASLCRYNFCTWQVWHETHICCQGMRKICSDDKKWNTTKWNFNHAGNVHYSDVIMSAMASQITGVLIVCLNVCSVRDERKHQSSMSLAFVRGIHQWQVNFPHKGPVTRKMFPFDDVIMEWNSSDEMGPRTLRQPNLTKVDLPYRGKAEMKAL